MKKLIVWFFVLISLIAILFRFSDKLAEVLLGIKPQSGISVLSIPSDATVYLDGKEAGRTPLEVKDLDVKDMQVRIEKNGASWQGKIRLASGTVTVLNRDIASDSASSAGEALTLDKGKGLTIVSNPTDAEIEIDGKSYGKTPQTLDIDPGDHTILVSHQGYLKRSIQAKLPENFNMTISIDLALSEVDLATIQTPVTKQTAEVLVKNTPTGFLRVRDKAGTNGKEIARVKPGDTLVLLEELGSWDKVRLPDGKEGFVSTTYVIKKTP